MDYGEWTKTVPETITNDTLWKVQAYRLGLFAADLGWADVTNLMSDKRTVALSDQLYRALGSISANIAEGYSRESQKDTARYYEYALGSARESRDWYYKARHILSDTLMTERVHLLTQIIRLLMTMVQHQRGRSLKEETETYKINDKTDP
ncbi:MAG: four helix bundle protein [Chloroflexota bacterium]|nr:four helix bundle protein [Chloroflexota bacterium]